MKIIVGKTVLAVALTCVTTPLVSNAQNIASQPGSVNRGLGRLTLLTGPHLLSPPHGAPQSTPKITIAPASLKEDAAPSFRFVPDLPVYSTKRKGSFEALPATLPAAPAKGELPPSPESLRFNATVPAIPVELPTESKPKRF